MKPQAYKNCIDRNPPYMPTSRLYRLAYIDCPYHVSVQLQSVRAIQVYRKYSFGEQLSITGYLSAYGLHKPIWLYTYRVAQKSKPLSGIVIKSY